LRDIERHAADSSQVAFVRPETLFAASPLAIVVWEEVIDSIGLTGHLFSWQGGDA
jgi:hypothetical protein